MEEVSAQRRQLNVILFIVFFGFVGLTLPYLTFPALFINPEFSILDASYGHVHRSLILGVILTAYPLGQFIGSPVIGALSDVLGRKKVMVVTLLLGSLCHLLTGLAVAWVQLPMLFVTRLLAGLMEGNLAIARSMATDLKAIDKLESLGKVNGATSIAYLIGPALGGILSNSHIHPWFGPSTPYTITAISFVFQGLAAAWWLRDQRPAVGVDRKGLIARLNPTRNYADIFRIPLLRAVMIACFLNGVVVDILYEFGPVHLTALWHLSPTQLTLFNSFLCVSLATGGAYLPALLKRVIQTDTAVYLSIAGLGACVLGIALTENYLFMLVLFTLVGFCISLGETHLTAQLSDAAPEEIQGKTMGVQLSLRLLGDSIICLTGGVLLIAGSRVCLLTAVVLAVWTYFSYGAAKRQRVALSI